MEERTKSVAATLVVGLCLNIALGVSKLVVGVLSRSVSVMSDALNNLSDAAVSVVSIIAIALSARAADKEHPYGHGRYEYVATFILGAVITAVGLEVLRNGIERAVSPVDLELGIAIWITLGLSVGVKAFMAVLYFARSRKDRSDTLSAAAVDSLSDSVVTTVVLICMLIQGGTGAHIDGYVSIALSVVILVFAFKILKSTIGRLLGERPDAALYDRVEELIKSSPNVISVHDIIINDYGETVKIAEADAVFPANMNFVDVHSECDSIEKRVLEETGVRLCIHADPLITDDSRLVALRSKLETLLSPFDAAAHDVGINDCACAVYLDIKLSDGKAPVDEIKRIVEAQIKAELAYSAEINIDYI